MGTLKMSNSSLPNDSLISKGGCFFFLQDILNSADFIAHLTRALSEIQNVKICFSQKS